LNYGPLNYLY